MHQPLWAQETDPVHWFDVEKLLANRKHTVFVGHRHHYERFARNNSQYYMLATTGGASPLRGPQLGEFDHFVWVTMTDRGPILANLHLDGVFDHDVFNEELTAFTRKLWASDIIKVEQPLYTAENGFQHDSVRFKITNDFDVPIKVKMNPAFSWDFKADIANPELTVPPNSVKFVSLELVARRQKEIDQMKPVKVKAEVAVQQEGKRDFFVPFELNAAPLQKYELNKTASKIKVDGSLTDWRALDYPLKTPENGSRFGITYDNKFVYLGIQVNDSEIIHGTANGISRQDYAGFVLDAQPFSKSIVEKGDEGYKKSLYFIASPEDPSGSVNFSDLDDFEKQLQWKCVKNKNGFAFEIAIPLEYVEKQQGEVWQNLRLNVVVQDRDANSSNRVFWQPNWRERDHVAGSGMFFRELKNKL
jgi:hypothetical protein